MNVRAALAAVAPKAPQFYEPLVAAMALHGIDTPLRVAHFLGQCAHESNGFTMLREGVNYSAEGLAKTWPNRFRGVDGKPSAKALALHRKPEAIANEVYANRMGNGGPETGDGWRTRGVGIIQLTGTNNLRKYSKALFGDERLVANPELALDPSTASQLACLFWVTNDLNRWADANDVDAVSDRINIGRDTVAYGDAIGFAHRQELTEKALKALEA